jgi:hypothetical protein
MHLSRFQTTPRKPCQDLLLVQEAPLPNVSPFSITCIAIYEYRLCVSLNFMLERNKEEERVQTFHTLDCGPFIKNQFTSARLSLGPYVEQIWSRAI